MFCIKSDVITLGSIEMYGLVTVWTSMDDEPYWVISLKYWSHDMRHTGFRRLAVVNGTPGFWGVTKMATSGPYIHTHQNITNYITIVSRVNYALIQPCFYHNVSYIFY